MDDDGDLLDEVFGALEIARLHDATSWNLQKVGLFNISQTIPIPPAFIRIFGGGDLTLTSLEITAFVSSAEDVIAVQKILIAHAPTLKKLDISQNSNIFPEVDIFPLPCNQVFEKVQVLKLGIKWRSARFLQAFPNVKKLQLEVNEIPEDNQTPNVTLDDCTQLNFISEIVEDEEFERLRNLLPNLKILQISELDNDRFSMLCQAWPDLTHLKLYDCMGLDDMGLSGYDRKDVRKINKNGRRSSWRPITVRRANLTSLKKLKSFCWKLHKKQYSKLGYCCEACGVLELPELKYLCVDLEQKDVSLPLFDNLADRFTWNKAQENMFEWE